MHTLVRLFLGVGMMVFLALAARANELAIAIVYDTSGSMAATVKDSQGKASPKYVIGNRALEQIVQRLENVAASGERKLQVGLFTFSPNGGNPVVPVSAFDPKRLREWLERNVKPDGGTPLGNAVADAARALAKVKADSRHVLIVTDGENSVGPKPEMVLPKVMDESIQKGQTVYFHFVAFDVNARVFDGVKRQGATLVSAADEATLKSQLAFVLEEKILLEKE